MNAAESGKFTPPDARKYIKESLETAQMLWDDTRISRIVSIPTSSSPLMAVTFDEYTIIKTQQSPEKAAVMSAFMDALTFLKTTKGFRGFMLRTISTHYDYQLPAGFTYMAFGIDLKENKLGAFEPDSVCETEQSSLEGKLKSVSTKMIGNLGITIPGEQEKEMTAEQTATLMVSHFKDPTSGQLRSAESIKRLYEDRLTGLSKVFQIGLIDISIAVDWADEFQLAYEDLRFSKTVDILRPVLGYLEPVT